MTPLFTWFALLLWFAGIALAPGVWLTLLAVVVPPYAWYVVVGAALRAWGWM